MRLKILTFFLKQSFMTPFHGWGSTASRPQSIRGGRNSWYSFYRPWKDERLNWPSTGFRVFEAHFLISLILSFLTYPALISVPKYYSTIIAVHKMLVMNWEQKLLASCFCLFIFRTLQQFRISRSFAITIVKVKGTIIQIWKSHYMF